MKLPPILSQRLTKQQIESICSQRLTEEQMKEFFSLILDADPKRSYNALWLWTHLIKNKDNKAWLKHQYDVLVSLLIAETVSGKRRLFLSLINQIGPVSNPRSELIDFCLDRMASSDEVAVRSFSIHQLTILVKQFPDLIGEIEYALELLENGEIPAAIASARRKLIKQIQKLKN